MVSGVGSGGFVPGMPPAARKAAENAPPLHVLARRQIDEFFSVRPLGEPVEVHPIDYSPLYGEDPGVY